MGEAEPEEAEPEEAEGEEAEETEETANTEIRRNGDDTKRSVAVRRASQSDARCGSDRKHETFRIGTCLVFSDPTRQRQSNPSPYCLHFRAFSAAPRLRVGRFLRNLRLLRISVSSISVSSISHRLTQRPSRLVGLLQP